jgi:hypothetical protein
MVAAKLAEFLTVVDFTRFPVARVDNNVSKANVSLMKAAPTGSTLMLMYGPTGAERPLVLVYDRGKM